MNEHLRFLQKRYGPAWNHVLRGDYVNTAYALKTRGYFTADPSAYAAGMKSGFDRAMAYDASAAASSMTPVALQEALKRLGYDPGPADGVIGPRTLAAIRRFQSDYGLKADAVVGPVTLAALENAVANLEVMT